MSKPLCSIRARIDIRQVAALAKFYSTQLKTVVSRNSIVSMAIADFHDFLAQSNLLSPVETLNDAVELLNLLGLTSVTGQIVRDRSFMKQLLKENLQLDQRGSKTLAEKVVGDLTKGGLSKHKPKASS